MKPDPMEELAGRLDLLACRPYLTDAEADDVALAAQALRQKASTGQCFECEADLIGPICPKCNPLAASAPSREEVAKVAQSAFEDALKQMEPCQRCSGKGYHHGFGEDGHDPDWCLVCGGAGFAGPTDDEAWGNAADAILALFHPTEEKTTGGGDA